MAPSPPARFLLLVEWDSLKAPETGFRRSDRFARWRALIAGPLAQPPLAEYFTDIASGARRDPDHDFFTG
ncbi:hypothetical protein [Actinoplanes hulinensis]|uniref:hypothetical protein n=1 Tax=Actinoplanes hulinensis TaxID=1144547 RepID=UPI0035589994